MVALLGARGLTAYAQFNTATPSLSSHDGATAVPRIHLVIVHAGPQILSTCASPEPVFTTIRRGEDSSLVTSILRSPEPVSVVTW